MDFFKFWIIIVVTSIVYYPIEKAFHFKQRFKKNIKFRACIVLIALADIAVVIIFGFLLQVKFMDSIIAEILIVITLLFCLMVTMPFSLFGE